MMIGIVTGCLLVVGITAIWFSPLRPYLLQVYSALDRYKFVCRVEQLFDESLSSGEDRFFQVQMIGRIPTTEDGVDTDAQLEILDITEGRLNPQQVLSADEHYRSDENAQFYFIKHNGIVPEKNSVLARWTTVVQFPCHVLRFSHRGRRKLMFCVTVIEAESGRKLVTDQKTVEYVYCSDGYREVHTRRHDILRSCVELAAFSLGETPPFSSDIKALWQEWIHQKSDISMPPEEAKAMVETIESTYFTGTAKEPSEVLLAYGQSTDSFLALELALQTVAFNRTVAAEIFNRLSQVSKMLDIRHDRFLTIAQKILLASECHIEKPSCLLGIAPEMDEESFRKRLNEEYRKWNARVTHPDAQIRCQADRILTLIAEIRTQRLQSCS